jgi:hypothetical protein
LKIAKGNVYVVTDIDINGKCKHGFVPITDVPVDEKGTTLEAVINEQNKRIEILEKRNVQLEKAVNESLKKLTDLVNNNQKITNDAIKEIADVVSKGRF